MCQATVQQASRDGVTTDTGRSDLRKQPALPFLFASWQVGHHVLRRKSYATLGLLSGGFSSGTAIDRMFPPKNRRPDAHAMAASHVRSVQRMKVTLMLAMAVRATWLLATLSITTPVHGGEDVEDLPAEVWNVIRQMNDAAGAADFASLRALMADDFTWSFGGDGDADQAISAWRDDPQYYLKALRGVLTKSCRREGHFYDGQSHVFCPGKTGTDFRAGFTLGKDGWKMRYFVIGD